MILISHRGNIEGPNLEKENSTSYINDAIHKGYNVEVDIWVQDDSIFLGHDNPQYEIDFDWIDFRKDKLWLHCKNIEAVEFFYSKSKLNYFWHDTDNLTITSKGFLWAYPGKQPIKKSIAVLPELHKDDVSQCSGICSDFIYQYKETIGENNL